MNNSRAIRCCLAFELRNSAPKAKKKLFFETTLSNKRPVVYRPKQPRPPRKNRNENHSKLKPHKGIPPETLFHWHTVYVAVCIAERSLECLPFSE